MQRPPRPTSGGSTPAIGVLNDAGVEFRVHTFDNALAAGDHGFGRAAADALGVDAARVFKTLLVSIHGDHDGRRRQAVGIVPVSGSLSLKAMATALGVKRVDMLDASTAERLTGYVVGGISPFGQRTRLSTVIDSSAFDHETILVSGGKRGLDVEVTPHDLLQILQATAAAIQDR
jgi:Cys-tRNA(Pro)/Cys-tRNA(Cys) deacylase